MCVQETKRKRSKAKSPGGGFKLFCHDLNMRRRVILKDEGVSGIVELERVKDRIVSLKLLIRGVILNAPQCPRAERLWGQTTGVRTE